MKSNTSLNTCLAACTLALASSSASAVTIFHGSSSPTAAVPMNPAEARAAWEAALASFSIDTLDGISGGSPITSAAGNIYTSTGNGSSIFGGGGVINGSRSGAPRIEFEAAFPAPVNAAGYDVIDNDGGTMTLELTDQFTGIPYVFNLQSAPGSGLTEFFGVVFDPTVFVTDLLVSGSDPGGITDWDNFSTGVGITASNPAEPSIPEPSSTLALCGLLLSGLVFRKR